ncbi:MAG: DUF4388 domain-containing protein [Myxococcota bacterium]
MVDQSPEGRVTALQRTLVVSNEQLLLLAAPDCGPWLACSSRALGTLGVVRVVAEARLNGALVVKDPRGSRTLHFEGGQFIGARSDHVADRLGEVLWRQGRVSLDQVLIAAEMMKEGRKLGRCLVDLGFISMAQLRAGLVDQAAHILEAACLEENATLVFSAAPPPERPMRFGLSLDALLARAAQALDEVRALQATLPPLQEPLHLELLTPPEAISESEHALWQLAASAKRNLTGEELLERSALGKRQGLRDLAKLLQAGHLSVEGGAPKGPSPEPTQHVTHQCLALNLVLRVLDRAGFGAGDAVRELVATPPPQHAPALKGLSLAEPLDPDEVLALARENTGGVHAMAAALQSLLDEALQQAGEILSNEDAVDLRQRVEAVLPPT